VAVYGFNDRLGLVSYPPSNSQEFQKPYGEATARMIDEEVKKIVDEAHERTTTLLTERRTEVEMVAQLLLDKEKISAQDVQDAIGDRPFEMKGGFDAWGTSEGATTDEAVEADAAGPSERAGPEEDETEGHAMPPPVFAASPTPTPSTPSV
jgi:AFG3 family protein